MTPAITPTDVSFWCRLGLVAESVRIDDDGGPKSTEQLPPFVESRIDAELHFTRRTQSTSSPQSLVPISTWSRSVPTPRDEVTPPVDAFAVRTSHVISIGCALSYASNASPPPTMPIVTMAARPSAEKTTEFPLLHFLRTSTAPSVFWSTCRPSSAHPAACVGTEYFGPCAPDSVP